MTVTRYRSKWNPEHELRDGFLAERGRMVARISVPKSELHLVGASGVEEVPSKLFLPPGMVPVYPRGRRTPGPLTRAVRAARNRPIDNRPIGHVRGRENARRLVGKDFADLYLAADNGFINLGLHFILDRIFNINTPDTAIDSMGISNDTTAVTATTLLIDPSAGSGSPDFQALGSGVGAAATSRTGNTVTCSAGWEPADFSTVFAITKVGLSTNAADSGDDTTPTVQGVVNIIGGVGGSAPYNEPFTIDLTTVSDFDLTLQQQITAQAT